MRKKNVLIIGGSSSLAKNLSKIFLNNNYLVTSTYNNNKIQNFKKINNFKSKQLDVEKMESIDNLIAYINNKKIKFDLIINLLGTITGKELNKYSDYEIKKMIDINVLGITMLVKKLIPKLNKNSTFINLSSYSAIKGSFDPVYASSKIFLTPLLLSLAKKYRGKIRFITLCPSLIKNSKMYKDMKVKNIKVHESRNLNKKLVTIKDLSKIIFDVSKDHWIHLNGSIIQIGNYV